MEKRQKSSRSTRSETKSKKSDSTDKTANGLSTLDLKFTAWKKKSKKLANFSFLDNQLFSDYLAIGLNPNGTSSDLEFNRNSPSRLKEALKYGLVIKYIENHADAAELDSFLHNVGFVYNVDKTVLLKEALAINKKVKKAPKKVSLEDYINQLLLENETQKVGSAKASSVEGGGKKSVEKYINGKVNGIEEKEVVGGDEVIEKKGRGRQTKDGVSAKLEKALMRQVDEEYPLKKKAKMDRGVEKEVKEVKEERGKEKKKGERKKKKEKEEKKEDKEDKEEGKEKESEEENKVRTRSFGRKKVMIEDETEETGEEEEEMSKEPEYMEFHINNEVDSDDGDNFSFFYVTENIYNKTKQYFEKKLRPNEICSCVEGCNDPTICPCARYNFETSGKTTCYTYDNKHNKKKLLNHLIRKDMHIYECSMQCACNKSLCLNSSINEGAVNRCDPKEFVIERYKKVYNGEEEELRGVSATMWGLKTKAFIPANTYVIEYCGEIITKKEGDKRGEKYDSVNCNYLFDLNKHVEIEKIDEAKHTILINIDGVCESRSLSKLKDITENFPLVIDAFFYGNHARFVNHSCSPNMVALAVHVDNRNILLPRIIFFALRDIQPGEELTIDYNCAPLKDLKNTEQLPCLCGAPTCRGFVYEEAHESDAD